MSAVGKAFRREQVEDQKQGLCANSFSAVVVARLLGSAVLPFSNQELDRGTLPQIWHRWGDLETRANLAAALLKKGWTAQHGGAASSQSSAPPGSSLTEAQKLVGKYLQLADHRGSDVRLDAGLPYRLSAWPRAPIDSGQWTWKVRLSYAWTSENHINILEAQAVFDFMRSAIKSPSCHDVRKLFLVDSQAALGVLTKGRSGSRRLNAVLQRIAAVVRGCNVVPLYAWVPSAGNPADGPSRWARARL